MMRTPPSSTKSVHLQLINMPASNQEQRNHDQPVFNMETKREDRISTSAAAPLGQAAEQAELRGGRGQRRQVEGRGQDPPGFFFCLGFSISLLSKNICPVESILPAGFEPLTSWSGFSPPAQTS